MFCVKIKHSGTAEACVFTHCVTQSNEKVAFKISMCAFKIHFIPALHFCFPFKDKADSSFTSLNEDLLWKKSQLKNSSGIQGFRKKTEGYIYFCFFSDLVFLHSEIFGGFILLCWHNLYLLL